MTTISLNCHYCGAPFTRRLTEYKRSIKQGRHVFCSLNCSVIWANKAKLKDGRGNTGNLRSANKRDEYSPFRYFRNNAKARKTHEYNLDLPYLKTLWEEQDGVCPLTGWQLKLPIGTKGYTEIMPDNASLDRADSELGYIKGNVRFIALIANYAKHTWGDSELIEFAHAVSLGRKGAPGC